MPILVHELPHRYQNQIAAQLQPRGKGKGSKLERPAGDGALAKKEGEDGNTGRFLVRVTSYRRRLLDEDNLSEKYFCDLCRYAGILPDDRPELTQIQVGQVKVKTEQEERTLIEVWFPQQ